MRELLPPDFPDLKDAPWALFDAIVQGLMFLGFEELPNDERPAKRIWLDPVKLKAHFDEVNRKREREAKGDSTSDEPMRQNAAASSLIVD